jgi:membrane-bound metal-dependent hydrolase YbcI (DUF457 family)
MPLPLGHAAIGLTTYELGSNSNSGLNRLKIFISIVILANLPDIDVIAGLLLYGNGNAVHRGPTHSILFALVAGFLASMAWKLSYQIPKVKFGICFYMILSHVLADFFLTSSDVSFFWPFEVHWTPGHSGWGEVLTSVVFNEFQDAKIILVSAGLIILFRMSRGYFYNIGFRRRNGVIREHSKIK